MIAQQQKGLDCVIAALCNMQEMPYERITQWIARLYGVPWIVIYALASREYRQRRVGFGMHEMAFIIKALWPTAPLRFMRTLLDCDTVLSKTLERLPEGEGVMVYVAQGQFAHIVAFQDGLIVDSNIPNRLFDLESYVREFNLEQAVIFQKGEQL